MTSSGKAEITAVTYQHKSPAEFKTYHVKPTGGSSVNSPSNHASDHRSRHDLPPRPRPRRRPFSPPQVDTAVLRRRYIYRHNLYSYHIGSNPHSGHRNFTPHDFATSPDLQSRARMFIRRELRVFSFLHTERPGATPANAATTSSNAEFLLMYIVSMLKHVDVKASDGKAEDLLQEFLGRENARLFLHELNAWLRSPFQRLEEWDEFTQYPLPRSVSAQMRVLRDTPKTSER